MSQLTPREQEIRHLLAQRLTNQEIGLVLHIGVRTVEHHVAQVMAKLGVTTRRHLAPAGGREFRQSPDAPQEHILDGWRCPCCGHDGVPVHFQEETRMIPAS